MKNFLFRNKVAHLIQIKKISILLILTFLLNIGYSQDFIGFDTIKWNINPDNIVDFDGRKCLSGEAVLKDVFFENGTIEFDIWTDGNRSYPGVIFRDKENGNYEIIYLRPHHSGLSDDAVQYTPAFNNTTCWQLYHGDGYTNNALINREQWNHIRIEVQNNKAFLYLNKEENPLLKINLVHQPSAGKIKLITTNKKNYISSFKLKLSPSEETVNSSTKAENTSGWEISKLLDANKFNIDKYPGFYQDFYLGWQKIQSGKNGLINISKYRNAVKGKENCIYARKQIYSEKNTRAKIAFGYSDAVKVFFNGTLIYSGNYAYRSRSNSFAGTIGLFDTLYVDLHKGINELFVASKDYFGGWGFYFNTTDKYSNQIADSSDLITKQWVTPAGNLAPESVVYDPVNKFIYYSNFNPNPRDTVHSSGYITKASLKGEIIEKKWVDNLNKPAGICLYKNKLYVAERTSVAEISIADGKLLKRYNFPGKVAFPNDIVSNEKGVFYITNTTKNDDEPDIFILQKGKITPWMTSDEFSALNGITYNDGKLYIGNTGKNKLQKIDINNKSISTITGFGSGVIDGIKINNQGELLVSLWRGELYKINKSGEISRLLYSIGEYNIADFEYIEDLGLIVIPTFVGKNIVSFKFR